LALQPDWDSQTELYQTIFDEYYTATLFNMDEYTPAFLEAMLLVRISFGIKHYYYIFIFLQGLEQVAQECTPNLMLWLMLTKLFEVDASNTFATLSLAELSMVSFMESTYINLLEANLVVRDSLNSLIYNTQELSGLSLFGQNYSNATWIAEKCYYANYGFVGDDGTTTPSNGNDQTTTYDADQTTV
jgi:hypothetical protein